MKKSLTLKSSFSSIDTSWKDKTPIISTETVRMATNISKPFLPIQLIFIVSNIKQIIFLLGTPWSREEKLLTFKSSSKTFTQNTKAISKYWHYWHQLIGTKKNPCVAIIFQSPIIHSNNTSTLLLTLALCYRSLVVFQSVIKNK